MRQTISIATFNFFLMHNHFFTIFMTFSSGSSNSSSRSNTSSSIIIIIIISSSSSNNISVLLTISTSIFELFICFLLFYINITHLCFLRDHNGNKVTQLFCVIAAIAPSGKVFYHSFQFIFVYVAKY